MRIEEDLSFLAPAVLSAIFPGDFVLLAKNSVQRFQTNKPITFSLAWKTKFLGLPTNPFICNPERSIVKLQETSVS